MADRKNLVCTVEIAEEAYDVVRARIDEALDEIPRLEARLLRASGLPKPATLLRADAVFRIRAEGSDLERQFSGQVTQAERRVAAGGATYLAVVIEPKLVHLTRRTNVRTFQGKKPSEVVKAVCEEAQTEKVKLQITNAEEPRDFVVQYRETDFTFVKRLLAEEGVAFTFDHVEKEIVFFDAADGIGEADQPELTYYPDSGFELPDAAVARVRQTNVVVADKATLRGYDFMRPRASLESTQESTDEGEHALEIYDFPARSTKEKVIEHHAKVNLESRQSRRQIVAGSTSSLTLSPGQIFSTKEHPFQPFEDPVMVTRTSLVYEGHDLGGTESRHRAELTFEAIPKKNAPARPLPRDKSARVPGLQTAVTTGPAGQEVHCDESGRVNAIYHWDRLGKKDETSSIPMRASQLPTGGSMLLPRVGWEVLVASDEGDVDLPLVVGRVYNAEKPPPYALPAGKTRSAIQTATTPGDGSSNEIRTEDAAGSEEMFFNASKDMTVQANNNATESIVANATLTIGGNQENEVTNSVEATVGGSQSITIGGNQKEAVETARVDDCAAHSLSVGGNRDMKVGGDHKHTVGGGETIDVGAMKTDLVVGKVSESAAGSYDLTVGAARATLTAGSYKNTVGGSHTETIGAAKIVVSIGSKSTAVTGASMVKIGGAGINLVDGDRAENAGATLTDVAAGAQIVKANNIVYEAETMLCIVMGASTITMLPAMVAIAGVSIKLDGPVADTGIVIDN